MSFASGHEPSSGLSSVNELSFLPINRPRSVLSAIRLSSIHGLPAADSRVLAAWEPARGAGRAPERVIFIVTNGPSPPTKPTKRVPLPSRIVNEDSSPLVRSMGYGIFVVTGQSWPMAAVTAPGRLRDCQGGRDAAAPKGRERFQARIDTVH